MNTKVTHDLAYIGDVCVELDTKRANVRVLNPHDRGYIENQSVEAVLLFGILKELTAIRQQLRAPLRFNDPPRTSRPDDPAF
jgi:hypothetical protein